MASVVLKRESWVTTSSDLKKTNMQKRALFWNFRRGDGLAGILSHG